MNALRAGIVYEWHALRAQPAALSVLVAAVLFYGLVYPLPYAPQVFYDVPVLAVDDDHSALSRHVLRAVDATEEIAVVRPASDLRAARAALMRGEAYGIIEIPAGFERRALRGEAPPIGVFANAGYLLPYSEIGRSASAVVMTQSAQIQVMSLAAQGKPVDAALAEQAPLRVSVTELFDPAGGYASFVVPTVLMVILQQTLLIGLGLLCQAHPATAPRPDRSGARTAWLIGRAVPYLAMYALQTALLLLAVYGLYGLPERGHPLDLLVFVPIYLLAAILLGLVLTESFHDSDAVIPVLLFTSLPVVFLSGFSWPREMMPTILQWLARLLPSTPGVEGFVRLNQLGGHLTDVAVPLANLCALCALYLIVLLWLTRSGAANRSVTNPASHATAPRTTLRNPPALM